MPSSARLICETLIEGPAVTCGRSELNCSHRCPRADRMSAFESSTPRFCFKPRSVASCNEIRRTPGTGSEATLPAKGPCTAGWLGLGAFGMDELPVCATTIPAQANKTAAARRRLTANRLPFRRECAANSMPQERASSCGTTTIGRNYRCISVPQGSEDFQSLPTRGNCTQDPPGGRS